MFDLKVAMRPRLLLPGCEHGKRSISERFHEERHRRLGFGIILVQRIHIFDLMKNHTCQSEKLAESLLVRDLLSPIGKECVRRLRESVFAFDQYLIPIAGIRTEVTGHLGHLTHTRQLRLTPHRNSPASPRTRQTPFFLRFCRFENRPFLIAVPAHCLLFNLSYSLFSFRPPSFLVQ